MQPLLQTLSQSVPFTDDLRQTVHTFLTVNGCPVTANHCIDVGAEARRVALRFEADPDKAEIAGWLHDISAVFPNRDRLAAARELGVEILPEEAQFPMIIHQKLSKVMAREIFHVHDAEILDSVGCHTTLRAGSTRMDQVLFVADKIAWDQPGTPPYIEELRAALEISLTHGAFAYIAYLWRQRDSLKVVHPWLREAYEELKGIERL
ncbi:HD domain-containing protein [Paenibacillus sp. HJGM_3]|uniref:HD domain-containing protein n=1 Tax=Paenibacillus sp. HJGM_3 TaxID=3379816 RepID=UPI00385C39D5